MEYKLTFADGDSAYLSHHGVKGMKWGVWNSETKARYNQGAANDRMRAYERGEKYTGKQARAYKKREAAKDNLEAARAEHAKNKTPQSAKNLQKAINKKDSTATKYEELREWNNPGKSKLTREQFNTFTAKKAYGAMAKWVAGPMGGMFTVPAAAVVGGPVAAAGAAAVHGVLTGSAVHDMYKLEKMTAQRTPSVNVTTNEKRTR